MAEEFMEVAKRNLEVSPRSCANRIYFAFEKAVIGYLLFKEINIPKNHKKIWEISSELLGEEYYSLFRELYDLRLQADYGSASVFVKLDVGVLREKIALVESLTSKIKLMAGVGK
ncbi:MAG: HEPN domain-containing protein [Nanoarchaeota archaeon]|nr:HEPN domain-containing protein [Nanoarchaeota archaeon]MBU1501626.1 HEPN domain-containing protein [Nanoarchaeota archaeon]